MVSLLQVIGKGHNAGKKWPVTCILIGLDNISPESAIRGES